MNKHQFNVEIQYLQHTHSHQKHRHFLQLLFISFGVCVWVGFFIQFLPFDKYVSEVWCNNKLNGIFIFFKKKATL